VDVITATVQAANPLDNAVAFRAFVLSWLAVLVVVVVAVRPLLLDVVDLIWSVRRAWTAEGTPPPDKESKP
jgi:hypothetical protein